MDDVRKMPRTEDVTEIDMDGEHRAVVVTITDENREYLARVALSMYLDEKCKYCLREFKTLDDLKDAVYAGYHEQGRIACTACWKANNPEI